MPFRPSNERIFHSIALPDCESSISLFGNCVNLAIQLSTMRNSIIQLLHADPVEAKSDSPIARKHIIEVGLRLKRSLHIWWFFVSNLMCCCVSHLVNESKRVFPSMPSHHQWNAVRQTSPILFGGGLFLFVPFAVDEARTESRNGWSMRASLRNQQKTAVDESPWGRRYNGHNSIRNRITAQIGSHRWFFLFIFFSEFFIFVHFFPIIFFIVFLFFVSSFSFLLVFHVSFRFVCYVSGVIQMNQTTQIRRPYMRPSSTLLNKHWNKHQHQHMTCVHMCASVLWSGCVCVWEHVCRRDETIRW